MFQSLSKQNHILTYTETQYLVRMEKQKYPLVIAYAITIHKSQVTLEFIVGDLNCVADKVPNATSVNRGHVYALLSSATSRVRIEMINFDPKHIKSNHEAKKGENKEGKSIYLEASID